ncbi:hypothetical protein NECID01_1463 [Nematocida sp. AWRm77]|nr:hypothetical protein NECID01_1463 [Nematocida sp. AWRm77]
MLHALAPVEKEERVNIWNYYKDGCFITWDPMYNSFTTKHLKETIPDSLFTIRYFGHDGETPVESGAPVTIWTKQGSALGVCQYRVQSIIPFQNKKCRYGWVLRKRKEGGLYIKVKEDPSMCLHADDGTLRVETCRPDRDGMAFLYGTRQMRGEVMNLKNLIHKYEYNHEKKNEINHILQSGDYLYAPTNKKSSLSKQECAAWAAQYYGDPQRFFSMQGRPPSPFWETEEDRERELNPYRESPFRNGSAYPAQSYEDGAYGPEMPGYPDSGHAPGQRKVLEDTVGHLGSSFINRNYGSFSMGGPESVSGRYAAGALPDSRADGRAGSSPEYAPESGYRNRSAYAQGLQSRREREDGEIYEPLSYDEEGRRYASCRKKDYFGVEYNPYPYYNMYGYNGPTVKSDICPPPPPPPPPKKESVGFFRRLWSKIY